MPEQAILALEKERMGWYKDRFHHTDPDEESLARLLNNSFIYHLYQPDFGSPIGIRMAGADNHPDAYLPCFVRLFNKCFLVPFIKKAFWETHTIEEIIGDLKDTIDGEQWDEWAACVLPQDEDTYYMDDLLKTLLYEMGVLRQAS